MATTQAYTANDENRLLHLILMYYRAIAAEEAYQEFTAPAPDGIYNSGSIREDIALATQHLTFEDVRGIQNLEQVKAALEGANFPANRGKFRKVGVVTGVDPEHYGGDWGVELEDTSGLWGMLTSNPSVDMGMDADETTLRAAKDDLYYNTGEQVRAGGNPDFGQPVLANSNPPVPPAGQVGGPYPGHYGLYEYIMSPRVAQFLLAKDPAATSTSGLIKLSLTTLEQHQVYQSMVAAEAPLPTDGAANITQFDNSQLIDARSVLLERVITKVQARPAKWQDFRPDAQTTFNIRAILNRGESYQTFARVIKMVHKFAPFRPKEQSDDEPEARATYRYIKDLVTDNKISTLYDELIKEAGRLLGGPYEDYREEYVKDEIKAIKEFFGVPGADGTELTDAPALATVEEVVKEEQAGSQARKGIAAAARRLTALDMQCYLLEHIRSIHGQRVDPAGKFTSDYKHVTQVATDNQSGPALLINAIRTGHIGEASMEVLLNLCPDVYALLQPYIRIYRVDYDTEGKVKGEPLELHIPNFLGDNLQSAGVNNITTSLRGRAAGSGLRSFSWELKGVQPAEVDNNITAKMEIYFQSIDDFFRGASQAGDSGAPNFLDLIINSPAVKKDKKTAANRSSKCARKNRYRHYEGENYRIKVVAGWAVPDENSLKHATANIIGGDVSALKNAISSTQVALYLQQVRHNLNFQEDGSVILDIDYQASLAGLLTGPTANILSDSPTVLKDKLKGLKEESARLRDLSQPTAQDKQNLEEYTELRKKILEEDRLIKYRKFLQGLLAQDCNTASRIYSMPVDLNELLLSPYSSLTPEQRAARAKRRSDPSFSTSIATPDALNLTLLGAFNKAQKLEGEKTVGEVFDESEQARYIAIQEKREQFKFIPFMFLGDLIDNVVEQIKINNGGTALNFRTLLADADIVDPLIAMQILNFDCLDEGDIRDQGFLRKLKETDIFSFKGLNGVQIKINLGDIPISLDAFQVWFKDNVIKKDRDKYYLLHFIKSICGDLISKAFDSDCFGADYNFKQRFDAQPLTLKKSSLSPKISAAALGRHMPMATAHAGNTIPALIVMPTDSRPSNLKGEYDDDHARGIYHHYIGAACGPLKTLSFNREDQEFLREMKIQKEGALGPEQLRELYSANIELMGNNLYQNGAYIYINPTLVDATKEELDYLGLHGYYLVTSVSSKITPEGFDTSITALHEGIEFGENPTTTPEVFAGNAEFNGGPPPNFATLSTDYWRLQQQNDEIQAAAAAGNPEAIKTLRAEEVAQSGWGRTAIKLWDESWMTNISSIKTEVKDMFFPDGTPWGAEDED